MFSFLILILSLCPDLALAQGHRPPVSIKPFVIESSPEFVFHSLEDEHGGFYLLWSHREGSQAQILAQHLDADGRALWPLPGQSLITSAPMDRWGAVADTQGGWIVVWETSSTIRSQRFS